MNYYLTNVFSWPSEQMHGYGFFHLTIVLLMILATIILVNKGRKHTDKDICKTVFIFGIFFAFLEIYKQLFYNVFEDVTTYQWAYFPFQLCSTPLYLCLLTPLFKGKLRKYVYNYLAFFGTIAGGAVIVNPDSVLVPEVTRALQTMFWHGGMVVLGIYLLATNHLGTSIKEMLPACCIFLIAFLIATILNISFEAFKVKYQLNATFNMFFISPYYGNQVVILNKIKEATNWFIYATTYVLAVILGALAIWFVKYLYNLIHKNYLNKKSSRKNI